MEALFLLIVICCAGIAFTLLLFGAWLIYSIFRLVGAGIEALFHPASRRQANQQSVMRHMAPGWVCQRAICRSANPSHAQFCRRCGRAVASEPVKARMALANL